MEQLRGDGRGRERGGREKGRGDEGSAGGDGGNGAAGAAGGEDVDDAATAPAPGGAPARWLSEISVAPSWWLECGFAAQTPELCYMEEDGEGDIMGAAPKQGLPLFGSDAVHNPSSGFAHEDEMGETCKDVIFHVGGSVWALDWCPCRQGWKSWDIQDEFLVVGAHPRQTPQHRLGEPLRGKGLLQIWAIDLTARNKPGQPPIVEEAVIQADPPSPNSSPSLVEEDLPLPCSPPADDTWRGRIKGRGRGGKWGRGRGRTAAELDGPIERIVLLDEEQSTTNASSMEHDVARSGLVFNEAVRESGRGRGARGGGRGRGQGGPEPCDTEAGAVDARDLDPTISNRADKGKFRLKDRARAKGMKAVPTAQPPAAAKLTAPEPVEGLPKLVLGIAHEGEVTWDAKWRPVAAGPAEDERESLRLGFLAVVLGDGSVQVFDVPLPSMLESAGIRLQKKVGKGPMMIRMNPVFRSSDLRSNGHKSVPLSVEWSTWAPHELLLVGCHDGTVAMFKVFPCSSPLRETRPLVFFTADFLTLRTVAWAPAGCGPAGKHLVATAGHSGYVRFWDLRDPFRPVFEVQISRGCVTSIDWISEPRCMLISMDDGSVRLFGFDNSATNTAVTGKPYSGTLFQGLQSYYCSFYAMWAVHVSRASGLVAYGGADGNVLHFQLTERAIVKEGARYRKPHYLSGAFAADSEASAISIISQNLVPAARAQKFLTDPTPPFRREFIARRNQALKSNGAGSGFLPSGSPLDMEKPGFKKRKIDEMSAKSKTGKKMRNPHDDVLEDSKDAVQLLTPASRELAIAPIDERTPAEGDDPPGPGEHAEPENPMGVVENLPLRVVAVQRLRWNCNKGRETWLAFGGACGILRCQHVLPKE